MYYICVDSSSARLKKTIVDLEQAVSIEITHEVRERSLFPKSMTFSFANGMVVESSAPEVLQHFDRRNLPEGEIIKEGDK